ncbi:MAG TPA: putative Ig domain-containing protein, partial [Prosthecobacter sp.]|nr:putative Ig domain-containing protein [Prosthecobacter sp.]
SMAVVVGDTVTMTVSATGANPRTYQWKRGAALLVDGVQANGAIISGAKTQTLTISNIPLAMADGYHCEVISDGFKMPPSAKGYVIVVGDTPLRVPLAIGTKADLKATVQIPASLPKTLEFPVTYYWLKDDVEIPLPDPNGRITTSVDKKTLTIKPLEGSNPGPGDSGIYKVKVVLHGREAIGRVAKLEVFHDKPDITNALSFPTGIVGGLYGEDGQGYQIPVDLDPAKAPVSFAWAGGTKLASEKTILTTPPAGLKLDTKTGRITGRPTKAGTYRLKVSATNTAGKDEVLNVEMVIEPLPTNLAGDYAGPLPRHLILNKNMGGRFDLKVTATGTFTGKLTLGPTTHSFSGLLEIVPSDVTQVLPHATVTIKRTGNPLPTPLILTLSINPAAQRLEVDAGNPVSTISDGTNTIAFHAWRNKWAGVGAPLATAYMANYTLALTIPDADRAADSTTVPQGFGYAAFTVAKNGTLTLTGKTADGETLTGAQFVGPEGEILVYVPLYTTNPKGSLLGTLFVDDEYSIVSTEDGDPANNVFNGVETLDWLRPKNLAKTARTYAAGIRSDGVTPLALTAVGGIAPPALPTSPLLGVTGTVNNAKIDFAAGGLVPAGGSPGSVIDPSIVFSINVKKITLPKYDIKAAVNPNPAKTTLTVDTKGIFKGTFALEDPDPRTPLPGKTLPAVKRTGNYAGVIIRNRTDGVDNIPGNGDDAVEYRGFGYFLLPQLLPPDTPPATLLTTSPILSGEVDLHTVPELD